MGMLLQLSAGTCSLLPVGKWYVRISRYAPETLHIYIIGTISSVSCGLGGCAQRASTPLGLKDLSLSV